MKKIFLLIFLIFVLVMPIYAYGAPVGNGSQEEPIVNIEELPETSLDITSGLILGETESTFDDIRTISGEALEGTNIYIEVYSKTASGDLKENSSYNFEVGVSGLFSQTVKLKIGENVIFITGSLDGYEDVTDYAVIKRKKRSIKTTLENGISIPGSNNNVVYNYIIYY